MNTPKISVIIPLYNAEKYIRQCLISVLASKFADYEVIVVDDCSTDNSVAEVEKLAPHFDGRLKIFHTEKNSGGPGIPRNIGIVKSAGKYVTFIDNDDMILPTALADFFDVAESFQADVVYSERFFNLDEGKPARIENFVPTSRIVVEELVSVPTLESSDLHERVRRDIAGKFFILPWGKFYRRDFLVKNKIDFPQMQLAEDVTFCFKCLCLAKKYVRIPNITNIRRNRKISGSHVLDTLQGNIQNWLYFFFTNTNILDEFMSGLKFFRENPDVQREVLNYYVDVHFDIIRSSVHQKKPHEVQKKFFEALKNPALNQHGKDIIAAYLITERALTT